MKMKKIFMCIISFLVLAGMWLLNFSGFSVLAETEPSKSHPNAVVYEAEDAKLSGGALKTADHTGYFGSGFVAGYDNSDSAKTTFKVTVSEAGVYYISFRYSAGEVGGWPNDRTLGMSVNDSDEEVTFEGTDSTWNTWKEYICKKELEAGENMISLQCITDSSDNSDCINLDRLSIWKYSENPVVDALCFDEETYKVSVGAELQIGVKEVNSNGIVLEAPGRVTLSSSDQNILKVNGEQGTVTGVKEGTAVLTAENNGHKGTVDITVLDCPTITADCSKIEREVDPCMFGYILTPNYDVPDSRLTLLGSLLNRETLPVQTFQAIGDLDGGYYAYEGSIKERHLEAYRRAKACGYQWYMVMGMNPSWATASGGPMDTLENKPLKTKEQLANFKQYIKDMLQYMKDNGAKPDFADMTNEYWTGTEETYRVVWEALREVYPDDIPAVGPGAVGYDGIPDFYIPYASENDITVEGPSWHAFWTSDTYVTFNQLNEWAENIRKIQSKYPKANGKYVIWEENNAGSKNPTDWTRSMSNVVRTGIHKNIKGCMEAYNSNGMSDLLTTNVKEQNPAARRPIWWVYYMFSQMSGDYVNVSTVGDQAFTGAVSVDKENKEAKVIVAKNDIDGPVYVTLNEMPFDLNDVTIDLYKITNQEKDGLEYQASIQPQSTENSNLIFSMDGVKANETWMAIVKTSKAKPNFFAQMTPDDGEVVTSQPEFTWSKAVGAETYTLTVSKNKDLSNPIIKKEGLTDTKYTATESLHLGDTYYWSVSAVNKNGSVTVSHDVKYSFLVGESAQVPGQFGPYLPSAGAKNEEVKPELKWSTAYQADSYHVIISKNKDFSNPVIDKTGVTTVRETGQFGKASQGYYQVKESLDYNTTYYWMVYAENSEGERPMNGVLHSFTTKAEGSSPKDFNLTYPEDKAVNISGRTELAWEESANAFFYQLEISDQADMSNIILQRNYMIYNKYTVEQNALEPGKTYYWRVTAYTKDRKESVPCLDDVRSFTVENTPNSPLLYAEYPGESDGTVTLWFRASDKADSYTVYYGKEEGAYTRKISGITGNSYTVSGLKGGQTYYFAVKAVNSAGESSIWNVRKAVPNGTGENWKENDEEGTNITPLPSQSPAGKPTPVPSQSMTPESTPPTVTPGKTEEQKTKVKKPAKVILKSLKSKKKHTLKITWKKTSADGYQIMLAHNKKMKKGKKTYLVRSRKATVKIVRKLKGKKKYYVKVRAFRISGKKRVYGSWSKIRSVRVK